MVNMTLINHDALTRREASRDHGRFGVQAHTSPELTIDADRARLDDLWDKRQAAADALAETDIALAAARMHDSISGIRFQVNNGTITPSRILASTPGKPVVSNLDFIRDMDLLTGYAQSKNHALELTPVHDGTDSWDWAPDPEDRAMNPGDARAANGAARLEFHDAAHDLSVASEHHIRTRLPENVSAVDIAYSAGGSSVIGFAYDEVGEPVIIDYGSAEWSDYRLILNRAPDTVHRIAETRHSDIIGTHFHLRRG